MLEKNEIVKRLDHLRDEVVPKLDLDKLSFQDWLVIQDGQMVCGCIIGQAIHLGLINYDLTFIPDATFADQGSYEPFYEEYDLFGYQAVAQGLVGHYPWIGLDMIIDRYYYDSDHPTAVQIQANINLAIDELDDRVVR